MEGLNYYRLQEYDVDGKYYQSQTIVVDYGNNMLQLLQLYPNPSKEKLSWNFIRNKKIYIIYPYTIQ